MKKQRRYSEDINAKDWIERNIDDVWEGIRELQRAIGVATLIALMVAFLIFKKLLKTSTDKIA